MDFREQNRRVWDERAAQRQQFATPASAAELRNPIPLIDQCNWLGGDVRGRSCCVWRPAADGTAPCSPRPERSSPSWI